MPATVFMDTKNTTCIDYLLQKTHVLILLIFFVIKDFIYINLVKVLSYIPIKALALLKVVFITLIIRIIFMYE